MDESESAFICFLLVSFIFRTRDFSKSCGRFKWKKILLRLRVAFALRQPPAFSHWPPSLGLSLPSPRAAPGETHPLSDDQARIARSSDSGKKLNRKNRSVSILLWTTAHARSSRKGAVGTLDGTLLLFCGIGIVSTFSHFIERFLTGPLAKAVSSAG